MFEFPNAESADLIKMIIQTPREKRFIIITSIVNFIYFHAKLR